MSKDKKVQEIVSWDSIREFDATMSVSDKALMRKAFAQLMDGSDGYEDKSTPEMEELFYHFKMGWKMHEIFCRGMVSRHDD